MSTEELVILGWIDHLKEEAIMYATPRPFTQDQAEQFERVRFQA